MGIERGTASRLFEEVVDGILDDVEMVGRWVENGTDRVGLSRRIQALLRITARDLDEELFVSVVEHVVETSDGEQFEATEDGGYLRTPGFVAEVRHLLTLAIENNDTIPEGHRWPTAAEIAGDGNNKPHLYVIH